MAVRYDSRQLHCLKAMGIVPWILRGEATPEVSVATVAEAGASLPETPFSDVAASAVTANDPVLVPELKTRPVAAFQFPDDQAALASGLAGCPLSVVHRRGVSPSESALKGRVILILESKHTSSSIPIDGYVWDLEKDEEQLLLAMLRSIGLAENDLCRTVPALSGQSMEDAGGAASVAQLHRQLPRLVLLLLNRFDPADTPAHHRLDGGAGVVGWRLPHPAVLLANPERKREAWEVLKAVRQTLSSS